jgi:hypothetical protein
VLPQEINIGSADQAERQSVSLSSIIIEKRSNLSILIQTDQSTVKGPLSGDRLLQADVHRVSGKSLVVRLFEEFPVETRGSNFEHVAMRDQILNIKDQPDTLTHGNAVIGSHSGRLVDENPERPGSATDHIRVNQFNARTSSDSLNDFLNTRIKLQTSSYPISDCAVI